MMIVVTGATGHIGNVLVRELLARGRKVRAVVPPGEDTVPLEGLPVEIVRADVRKAEQMVEVVGGAEMVYHLAGVISIIPGRERLLYQVNVGGTQNIVQACLRAGVGRLVYTSSVHALVEPPSGQFLDEEASVDPKRGGRAIRQVEGPRDLARPRGDRRRAGCGYRLSLRSYRTL
ncbi:MAG: NAD-dependent epimerase/dehydratase family protein [Bacillota bacterium]